MESVLIFFVFRAYNCRGIILSGEFIQVSGRFYRLFSGTLYQEQDNVDIKMLKLDIT